MGQREAPEETIRKIAAAALAAASADNVSALVLDVADLPSADAGELEEFLAELQVCRRPTQGL